MKQLLKRAIANIFPEGNAVLLVVGLGNPEPQHANTRHNAGFMAADLIAEQYGFSAFKQKFDGLVADGRIGEQKILLLKPMTYMNLSGKSVRQALQFYKIPLSQVIVIYDELDLLPGKVRVKTGGGSGGHNGIKDIDSHIGKEYHRVRVGIGHPGHKDQVSNYVLKPPKKEEKIAIDEALHALVQHFPLMLAGDAEAFMSKVALDTEPPARKKPIKETSDGV